MQSNRSDTPQEEWVLGRRVSGQLLPSVTCVLKLSHGQGRAALMQLVLSGDFYFQRPLGSLFN